MSKVSNNINVNLKDSNVGNITKGIILILINTALWGLAPWIIKQGLINIPAVVFLYFRYLIVTALFVLLYFKDLKKVASVLKNKKLVVSAFLFNFVTLFLYFEGLSRVTALQGGILAGLAPLFVILPMVFTKQETLTLKEIIGISIMILGYVFILVPVSGSSFQFDLLGTSLILLGNVATAIAIIINKKYLKIEQKKAYEFVSYFLALIGFFVLTAILHPHNLNVFLPGNLALLFSFPVIYVAIFASLIAFSLFNSATLYLEASEAISFSYAQPVFTALLAIILGHKQVDVVFVIGLILVTIGIIYNIIGIYNEHKQYNN